MWNEGGLQSHAGGCTEVIAMCFHQHISRLPMTKRFDEFWQSARRLLDGHLFLML